MVEVWNLPCRPIALTSPGFSIFFCDAGYFGYSVGCNVMVPSARSPAWLAPLFHSDRYVVGRVYLRRNGDAGSSFVSG